METLHLKRLPQLCGLGLLATMRSRGQIWGLSVALARISSCLPHPHCPQPNILASLTHSLSYFIPEHLFCRAFAALSVAEAEAATLLLKNPMGDYRHGSPGLAEKK